MRHKGFLGCDPPSLTVNKMPWQVDFEGCAWQLGAEPAKTGVVVRLVSSGDGVSGLASLGESESTCSVAVWCLFSLTKAAEDHFSKDKLTV